MSNQYELLPSSDASPPRSPRSRAQDSDDEGSELESDIGDSGDHNTLASAQAQLRRDPRFNPSPPSPLKRFALIAFIVFLFWLAFALRSKSWRKQIVHANRYSKEFKFRPAASPVITETLVDGRVRLRGAQPTPTMLAPQASKKTIRKGKKNAAKKGKKKTKAAKDL